LKKSWRPLSTGQVFPYMVIKQHTQKYLKNSWRLVSDLFITSFSSPENTPKSIWQKADIFSPSTERVTWLDSLPLTSGLLGLLITYRISLCMITDLLLGSDHLISLKLDQFTCANLQLFFKYYFTCLLIKWTMHPKIFTEKIKSESLHVATTEQRVILDNGREE
jgi:hypothetical protein